MTLAYTRLKITCELKVNSFNSDFIFILLDCKMKGPKIPVQYNLISNYPTHIILICKTNHMTNILQ